MEKARLLITGATGFIGRFTCELLSSPGVLVRVLSRERANALGVLGSNVEIIEGEICDPAVMGKALEGVSCVFHLAAETKLRKRMYRTNVEGTESLLNAATKSQVRRIVYLSSAGVAGQGKSFSIDEETPCLPQTEYESTKLEAEGAVRRFSSSSGISVSILRPTIVFGEGKIDENESFYQLMRHIKRKKFFVLNSGRGAANYVYVGDVAKALLSLYHDERPGCHAYIVNDLTDMRIFFSYVCEALGISYKPLNLPYAPVRAAASVLSSMIPGFPLTSSRLRAMNSPYRYSSEKIKRELDFTFDYGLKQGIARTVAWLKEKGWL